MMLNLAGYQETHSLYVGTRTLVYRAIRESDRQPVIIKVLRNPNPSFNDLVQFRNQYIITRHLKHAAIVRPIALERYGNGYALVMSDLGAIALTDYWKRSNPSVKTFLAIAIQLSEALHYLVGQHIIHKDIKPNNILIDRHTGQVQLIDFSISTLLPKEQQQAINPNILEGTLAYISPEQTGRMNRGIDYRSDFYSLGVTFYQLLMGKLPFETTDPMELVHCHIAKIPERLDKKGEIPEVLADIVLKLMAKNAEDRYQSALGLQYDLERCLQQLNQRGAIERFKIAERDVCDRFTIPEKLYGRESEVQRLLDAFEQIANHSGGGNIGKPEMILVAGFSGIGKTAVVNEVHKPIVRQRGYFLKGKFDQFNRNIPLSAIAQALSDLMRQLLSQSDAQLQTWRENIQEAVGENGQALIEIIPELAMIIGPQPSMPELSGNAAQNRFNRVFQNFVRTLATPAHPLVIFLDDLQWADTTSLQLLQLLFQDNQSEHILFIGAYRDNEVSPVHPLMQMVAELEETELNLQTITLAPLTIEDINLLMADTLKCSVKLVQPLTTLVYSKTQGNPFFTNQFLKSLYNEGAIEFERSLGYWQCDLTNVRSLTLSDDVVEFMAFQLKKLPHTTQEAIKVAACIGNQFDLETLAVVREESALEISDQLWAALQEGLILPNTQVYKFFQAENDQELPEDYRGSLTYRFLHDRVQQAAYTLIPTAEKQATHLQIGQLLFNNTPESEQEEKIFTIVNQFNVAIELIGNREERDKLAQLNLIAGQKAKASTAYGAAYEYVAMAIQLLGNDSWTTHYDLSLQLYILAIEIALFKLDVDYMNHCIEVVLAKNPPILDRSKIYQLQVQKYIVCNEFPESIEFTVQVMNEFGIKFPSSPTPDDMQFALEETRSLYADLEIKSLGDRPLMTDPNKQAAMPILTAVLAAAYNVNPILFVLIILQMVNLSIQYGNSPFSAYGYVNYGTILCGILGDIELGYKFGQLGIELQNKFNLKELKPKVLMVFNTFVRHWKEHIKSTIKPNLEVYQSGLEVGEWEFAGYGAFHSVLHAFAIGKNLIELEIDVQEYCNLFSKSQVQLLIPKNLQFWQTILNLIGRNKDPLTLNGLVCNESEVLSTYEQMQDGSGYGSFYLQKMILCYLCSQPQKAFENALKSEKYLDQMMGTCYFPLINFYASLCRLALYPQSSPEEQNEYLNFVNQNQEKMLNWANHAPMNYQHKYDLVEAEKYRVLSQHALAMKAYNQSIAGAKANGYLQEEALANELAAKFYLNWDFDFAQSNTGLAQSRGKEKVATAYMQKAYYGYAHWGAKAKTDQLEKQYSRLLSPILQTPNL